MAMHSARSGNKISPANRPSEDKEGGIMRERQNWRIFSAFARQEHTECLQIIEEQLQDCDGMAEYPIYVKGKQYIYICKRTGLIRVRADRDDSRRLACGESTRRAYVRVYNCSVNK